MQWKRCLDSKFKFLVLGLALLMNASCSSLYYWPTSALYGDPWEHDIPYENIFFKSSDGTRLHAWLLKHKGSGESKGLITFFHGNAQNLTSHAFILSWLTSHGYDLFIFDYRGYGLSEGLASHSRLPLDAQAALEYSHTLLKKHSYPHWILYGQSLGGAVLARALVDYKDHSDADLLVLDSTFSSYLDLAKDKMRGVWLLYPLLPLAPFLISDEYASAPHLGKITTPTLVIHGERDLIIPAKFGSQIYERLNAVKWYWKLPDAGHIDGFFIESEKLKPRFLAFLEQNLK